MIYGAASLEGAISETVFHDVPVRGTKTVDASKFQHHLAVTVAPTRHLNLADLTGPALTRMGVSRAELIDSDSRGYGETAAWARAIHHHRAHFDGLLWISRQYDRVQTLMLFGDRVTPAELPQHPSSVPTSLRIGSGLDKLLTLADAALITVTGLE